MELKELRQEIDDVDRELVRLFCRRMEISAQIAAYKQENGLPVRDPQREKEKLNQVRRQTPEPFGECAARLFEQLMALSRAYQQQLLEGSSPVPDAGKTELPAHGSGAEL